MTALRTAECIKTDYLKCVLIKLNAPNVALSKMKINNSHQYTETTTTCKIQVKISLKQGHMN